MGLQEQTEGGGGGDPKTHHIQVITADHLVQVEDKTGTVYYPPITRLVVGGGGRVPWSLFYFPYCLFYSTVFSWSGK